MNYGIYSNTISNLFDDYVIEYLNAQSTLSESTTE